MDTRQSELEASGWVRVAAHSSYWKAPDDTGPSGRKWMVGDAHREHVRREAAKPPPAARRSEKKPATRAET